MARAGTPVATSVRRLTQLLLIAFVVIHFVLPQVPKVRDALPLFGSIDLRLVLLAVAFEAASISSYTMLTASLIPREPKPGFLTLLRIQLSTLAISHVVPGGSAAGAALGFRLLTRHGLRGTDAAFVMATQGMGSAVVLNILLWVGLVVSIPLRGYNPLYAIAAVLGVLLIGGFSTLVVLLVRGQARAAGIMRAASRRVPFLDEDKVGEVVLRLAGRLQTLARQPQLVRRAVLWDVGFWLCTATALWLFVSAFGHRVPVDGLIVSFGLAYVMAAVPITPAGLGVVEVVLVSLLTFFGAPVGAATLGVVLYRLVNFWLPIPLGALAYLSLQVEEVRGEIGEREARAEADRPELRRRREDELRRLAEEAINRAEDRRAWAERHGLRVPSRPDASSDPAED
ncbi:MAG TPA: lysylphosphatidylglycerol synthase transmembrane domain-containing protein [Actinomycetota bacterium]|jgi:putative heme transporter